MQEPGTNSSVAMCVFMENATLPGIGEVTWNQLNFQVSPKSTLVILCDLH